MNIEEKMWRTLQILYMQTMLHLFMHVVGKIYVHDKSLNSFTGYTDSLKLIESCLIELKKYREKFLAL